jgi:arylformamidase
MNSHTGTHVELPYHCLEDGKKVEDCPPEMFLGEAAVVDLTSRLEDREISTKDLEKMGAHIKEGDIVLLKTGFADKYISGRSLQSDEFASKSPYLTFDALEWLINKKIKLLGSDTFSFEKFPIIEQTGHLMIFKHDITTIHCLVNLSKLEANRVFFVALPLLISGLDTSPVRAVAIEFE